MLTNHLSSQKMASIDTGHLSTFTCLSPMAAEQVLDISGRQLVQPFHQANTGRLPLVPLEWKQCKTSGILITPNLLHSPLKTEKSNTFKQETVKNIL